MSTAKAVADASPAATLGAIEQLLGAQARTLLDHRCQPCSSVSQGAEEME